MGDKKGKRSKSAKKGRKGLSTEDILKLIKKLKPKQSQSVRINIGDKGKQGVGGSGGGGSPYFPLKSEPAVVFTHAPPPVITVVPPPTPSMIAAAPTPSTQLTTTSTFQPKKIPQPLYKEPFYRAPSRMVQTKSSLSKPESYASSISTSFGKRLAELHGKSFSETGPASYSYESETEPVYERWKPSTRTMGSSLSKGISDEFMITTYPSVVNDPYAGFHIGTVDETDQIGVRSNFNTSSDTWTGTPSGEVMPSISQELVPPDVMQETLTEPPLDIPEAFQEGEESMFASPLAPLKETSSASAEASGVTALRPLASKKEPLPPIVSNADQIKFVNDLIEKGLYSIPMGPNSASVIYLSGKKAGTVRKGISDAMLKPIWIDAQNKSGIIM